MRRKLHSELKQENLPKNLVTQEDLSVELQDFEKRINKLQNQLNEKALQ
jgi:hypothetical protein